MRRFLDFDDLRRGRAEDQDAGEGHSARAFLALVRHLGHRPKGPAAWVVHHHSQSHLDRIALCWHGQFVDHAFEAAGSGFSRFEVRLPKSTAPATAPDADRKPRRVYLPSRLILASPAIWRRLSEGRPSSGRFSEKVVPLTTSSMFCPCRCPFSMCGQGGSGQLARRTKNLQNVSILLWQVRGYRKVAQAIPRNCNHSSGPCKKPRVLDRRALRRRLPVAGPRSDPRRGGGGPARAHCRRPWCPDLRRGVYCSVGHHRAARPTANFRGVRGQGTGEQGDVSGFLRIVLRTIMHCQNPRARCLVYCAQDAKCRLVSENTELWQSLESDLMALVTASDRSTPHNRSCPRLHNGCDRRGRSIPGLSLSECVLPGLQVVDGTDPQRHAKSEPVPSRPVMDSRLGHLQCHHAHPRSLPYLATLRSTTS